VEEVREAFWICTNVAFHEVASVLVAARRAWAKATMQSAPVSSSYSRTLARCAGTSSCATPGAARMFASRLTELWFMGLSSRLLSLPYL
jgi:hypothetical protein